MIEPASLNMNGLKVAGMLAVVGAAAYVIVGGPLVVTGGSAIGLMLIAYRRWHGLWRHGSEGPTSLLGVQRADHGQRQPPRVPGRHFKLVSASAAE
jgi:hypothetical protein